MTEVYSSLTGECNMDISTHIFHQSFGEIPANPIDFQTPFSDIYGQYRVV